LSQAAMALQRAKGTHCALAGLWLEPDDELCVLGVKIRARNAQVTVHTH
jgi:hypothetical protein